MSKISNIKTLFLGQKSNNIFSTKAVSHSSNLLISLALQELDRFLDDRINLCSGMWVLSIASLFNPLHDIETFGTIKRKWVAVENIGDDGVVAVGCELIGH